MPCDPRPVTACPPSGSARASQVRSPADPAPAGQEPLRRASQRHPASEPVILTRISPAAAQVRALCACHQLTLTAAAKPQTTGSSPRGTFSQAELGGVSNSPRVLERADGCLPTAIGPAPGLAMLTRCGRAVLIFLQSSWNDLARVDELSSRVKSRGVGWALALVRDLREHRASASAEELADLETGGLARASAGSGADEEQRVALLLL